MGKTIIPTYRIEASYVHFTNRRREIASMGWDCKQYGRPTPDNIKRFFRAFEVSLKPGECNHHIAHLNSPYGSGKIIRQKTGEVVAEYSEPAFRVVD